MCSVHWEQGDGVPKEKVIYLKPLPETAALPLVSDSSLPHAALYLLHILPPIPSSHCSEVVYPCLSLFILLTYSQQLVVSIEYTLLCLIWFVSTVSVQES